MISDRALKIAAAVTAGAGIILLGIIASSITPENRTIGNITAADAGTLVRIQGEIAGISHGSALFFTLRDGNATLKGVLFKAAQDPETELEIGMQVLAVGKITIYKGSLELEAESIKPFKLQK